MIEWERIWILCIVLGLGLSSALLGIGWHHNHMRIDVLSKRIYDLEQKNERR